MAVEVVEGKAVTVRFDGSRCIHSRRCVMGAPTAFRANVRGAWIDPDSVEAEAVMRVALACPSGAITVERKDGGTPEGPPAANQMQVRENGPLAIHADLEIAGHGRMYRATLCRCGMSKSKPFCDNSHVAAGFVATKMKVGLGVADDIRSPKPCALASAMGSRSWSTPTIATTRSMRCASAPRWTNWRRAGSRSRWRPKTTTATGNFAPG